MATGRTVSRWVRFVLDDDGGDLREIPINSVNGVGLEYPETDVSAFQDAVKGVLSDQPDCSITVTGPFDNSAEVACAASGLAPTLSGSHTVLNKIVGLNVPLALGVLIGIRGYYTTGDPAFGLDVTGTTSGFICTAYNPNPDDGTYSATFRVYPGSDAPNWIDDLPTS
jgi:hypothetical protein